MSTLLEVDRLSVGYETATGYLHALRDISLEVEEGTTLGLIGGSGSGKSTLALAIMRLLPRNASMGGGRISCAGRDTSELPLEEFRRRVRWKEIAMVFQGAQNALNPVLSVERQVTERLLLDGIDPKAARATCLNLIERVGLAPEVMRRYPHELSGGMKQRVMVAMALTLSPRLLILDEPTSALDVSVQAQIMNLFKELQRETGVTMLFITHDLSLASDLSDRIAVLEQGELREIGLADQVMTAPEHLYTRRLLDSLPRLHVESPAARQQDGSDAAHRDAPAADLATDTVPVRALVRTDDLRVHYQSRAGLFRTVPVKAVDSVSLSIARGETLAVVGESGCGKTTLGKATMLLVPATGGRVYFDGQDVTRLRGAPERAFRRRVQAVFQDPFSSISPYMSIFQIVEEPLVVDGVRDRAERERRVFAALEQVRLTPPESFADTFPHRLSGGQRQRVSIARTLVLDPDYIVADEPVSMIDASNRLEILRLLRDLQDHRGLSYLYITHDIASARHFARRIAVMYLGTIVEQGPIGQVIDNPLHPYTQALIEAVPEPDPANRHRLRQVIRGEPPEPTNVPPGCPFHPRCPSFMAGACDGARPRLTEQSPGHKVACYLYS